MFVKLLLVLIGAAIGGVAFIHFSSGPMHDQFDPYVMDAVDTVKGWIPG